MNRLELIRQTVNEILMQQSDLETRHSGFVHLYAVSATCALLAIRRGLDPQLCAVAGMLHDIWTHKTGDPTDHARFGALEAERILTDSGRFDPEEIAVVCAAISRHSSKDEYGGAYDELLKDADVLAQGLYGLVGVAELPEENQTSPEIAAPWINRWNRVSGELGLSPGAQCPRVA